VLHAVRGVLFLAAHGGRGAEHARALEHAGCGRHGRCRAYSLPAGYATRQTVAQNVDGSTTVDVNAFNPDGSLANETVSSTSLLGWK